MRGAIFVGEEFRMYFSFFTCGFNEFLVNTLIYITLSPSPIESHMNIIFVRNKCAFLPPQNTPRYSVRIAFLNISSVCCLQNKRGINYKTLYAYLTQCLYFPMTVRLPCLFLSEISIYLILFSHSGLS
jgi:hypothetical protein